MPTQSFEARATYWQAHIDNCHQSELSGAAYCQSQGLVYHQFIYGRRKLGGSPVSPVVPSAGFSQVVLQSPQCTTGLYVRLPDGVEIHGIDTGYLAMVHQLLSGL